MAGDTSKKSEPPGWYAGGLEHIWLPYAQMKTAAAPLPVGATHGSRIVLSDGRELIDEGREIDRSHSAAPCPSWPTLGHL